MLQRKSFIDATSNFMRLCRLHLEIISKQSSSKCISNKRNRMQKYYMKVFSLFMIYKVFLYKNKALTFKKN